MTVSGLAYEAALRYVAMVPMRTIVTEQVAEAVGRSASPSRASRDGDPALHGIVRIFVSEIVAHFTVGELHALVRFYSSPDGQGVMGKLLALTRDLEAEVVKAIDAELLASAPPPV